MLLSVFGSRHTDILFGNGNGIRKFPSLIELQAALVDRL
jgi:hypothetical protein